MQSRLGLRREMAGKPCCDLQSICREKPGAQKNCQGSLGSWVLEVSDFCLKVGCKARKCDSVGLRLAVVVAVVMVREQDVHQDSR